jgi:hypothetical protein
MRGVDTVEEAVEQLADRIAAAEGAAAVHIRRSGEGSDDR